VNTERLTNETKCISISSVGVVYHKIHKSFNSFISTTEPFSHNWCSAFAPIIRLQGVVLG